jgi:hypothetical protein
VRRARADGGFASLEFIVLLPLLAVAAALAWQILLMASAATAAENAARTGSRAESRGDSAETAAREALPEWLREDAEIDGGGTRVSVRVEVPVLFPRLGLPQVTLSRTAELPPPS